MDNTTRACAGCGDPIPGHRSIKALYCSQPCRRRADDARHREERRAKRAAKSAAGRVPKPCKDCGAEFIPPKSNAQRFCSDGCAKRWSNRAAQLAKPPCAEDGCGNKSVSGGLCRKHHPTAPMWSRGTVETRRANLRRRTQLRRALTRDPAAESIDRHEIGARDGWRCGLCSKKVDPVRQYPDPRSASLDHIVPLSRGGKHTRLNVQIAHLGCNVAKGNRGGNEQLLLVG